MVCFLPRTAFEPSPSIGVRKNGYGGSRKVCIVCCKKALACKTGLFQPRTARSVRFCCFSDTLAPRPRFYISHSRVSSKMRRLIDVDPCRKHIVTTYGSSPFLDPHLSKPRVDRSPSQSPFGNKISTVPQTNDSLYHAGKYGYLNQMLGGEGHVPLDS